MYTLNNELENLLTNVVNQAQQGGKVMLDSVPVDPNMPEWWLPKKRCREP